MVPGIIICIAPGSMTSATIALLRDKGITVIGGELEPQAKTTEDLTRWLSDVQTKQVGQRDGEKARPPWIRKATGRAPRRLGFKGR